jgi:hypothetical protein
MAVADLGVVVALLHFARVLPHLELVEQSVVEVEPGEGF